MPEGGAKNRKGPMRMIGEETALCGDGKAENAEDDVKPGTHLLIVSAQEIARPGSQR
jgi:hypothetical protein